MVPTYALQVFGVLGGILGAAMCACTKVWDTAWKRALIVFTTARASCSALFCQRNFFWNWL